MNHRRSETCPPAPRSRTSTPGPSAMLASPRVHLQVRIALELADLYQGLSLWRRQPRLRSPVAATLPGGPDQRPELPLRGPAAQRLPQIRPPHRVQAEIPEPVGGEPAPITAPAERLGRGGEDADHASVGPPERSRGGRRLLLDRHDRSVARLEAGQHLGARDDSLDAPVGRAAHVHVLDEAPLGGDAAGILPQAGPLGVLYS